jgi:hypothetical protein
MYSEWEVLLGWEIVNGGDGGEGICIYTCVKKNQKMSRNCFKWDVECFVG